MNIDSPSLSSSTLPAELRDLQLDSGPGAGEFLLSPSLDMGGVLPANDKTEVAGDDPALVLAQDVALIIRPTAVCGAFIGSSKTKFCLKLVEECTTKSHKEGEKVCLSPNLLVLRDHKRNHAFISGYLSTTGFDNPDIMELMNKSFPTRQEWMTEIALYKAQDDKMKLRVEADRKLLQSTRKRPKLNAESFKSPIPEDDEPIKLKFIDSFVEEALHFKPLQPPMFKTDDSSDVSEELEPPLMDLQHQIDMLAAVSKEIMGRVNVTVTDTATALHEVSGWMDSSANRSKCIEDTLSGHWHSLTNLEGVIGQATDKDFEPTLWGTFSWAKDAIHGSAQSATRQLSAMDSRLNDFGTTLQAVQTKSNVQSTYPAFKDGVVALLQSYKTSITSLQRDMASVGQDLFDMRQTQPTTGADPDLAGLGLGAPPSTMPSTPAASSVRMRLGNVRFEADAPNSDPNVLPHLVARVTALESRDSPSAVRGTDMVVHLNGSSFRSLQDVEAWMSTHLTSSVNGAPGFGMFVDPFTVLHMVHTVLTQRNLDLKEMSLRKQMRLSQAEHYAVEAAQYLLPKLFTGNTSDDMIFTGGSRKSRFKMLPKAANWEDELQRDGLKYQLKEQLESLRAEISTTIADSLYDKPEARSLAVLMLSKSMEFISQLSAFISETYADINRTHKDATEAWELVCYVVEQIFKNQFSVARSVAKGNLDTIDMRKLGARILWSSMRTISVADEYMAQSIANHPSVSASYIRFLVSNTQTAAVAALTKTVNEQKATIKTLQDEVKGVKKIANSVQDKVRAYEGSGRGRGGGTGSGGT